MVTWTFGVVAAEDGPAFLPSCFRHSPRAGLIPATHPLNLDILSYVKESYV
jgi:hypothetical protein